MSRDLPVNLEINGAAVALEVPLTETLLATLRERLQLTGAKRGCNQGVCGACTVTLDGVAVRACLSLTLNCEGQKVATIEGVAADPLIEALQQAFVDGGALQCGFCTPGQLIAARALLSQNSDPSVEEVQQGLSGNLCRCTGYRKIIDAVLSAARSMRK
ncbi:MAG: (2Fe-2S)-binding protein [Betaproteobacteria bacterium]|nr:(2Fe-2S)-binding protein [Betaproteobacteria bacterium]